MTMVLVCLQLTFNAPPANNKEAKEIREMQLVARSQRLRQFWRFIPESSFNMRKGYFVEKVSMQRACKTYMLSAVLVCRAWGGSAWLWNHDNGQGAMSGFHG